MTIHEGWFSFAVREPGPPARRVYADNNLSVLIAHSLEGRRGSYSAMFDPARHPTAWHGTVAYDGVLYQHYPVQFGLQASNAGNLLGPAIESEGIAGEPLAKEQVVTWLMIIEDMEAYTGRKYRPGVRRKGLTEHNHWGATACPSGRYQTLYDAIAWGALEEDMTTAEKEEMTALRQRRELAAFVANLDKYHQMQELYAYAKSQGFIP